MKKVTLPDLTLSNNPHAVSSARLAKIRQVVRHPANPLLEKTFRRLLADRDIATESSTKRLSLAPDGRGASNIVRRYITTSSEELSRDVIQRDLLSALNEIFGPDGRFTEIQIKEHDDNGTGSTTDNHWEIYLGEAHKGLVPLSKSGSGLKTVLLVLLNLLVIPDVDSKEFQVNPNIVVVCDGDRSSKRVALKDRVRRIRKEVDLQPAGHIWVTRAREIENYIPGVVLGKASDVSSLPEPGQFDSFFPRKGSRQKSYIEENLSRQHLDKDRVGHVKRSAHDQGIDGVSVRLERTNGEDRRTHRVLEPVKSMDRVDVEPELLRWARERAGLSIDALAGGFPSLHAWERREVRPTLKQLERFAKATFTPIGYLFLRVPPIERIPIPDFRTVADARLDHPSANLLDTIYLCQQRQDWYREFVQSTGGEPVDFVGSARPDDDISETAARIRRFLAFDIEERRRFPTWTDALRRFIGQADALGVLVMVSGVVGSNSRRSLDPLEFRGFALADSIAPLVFINGADTKSAPQRSPHFLI